jgi:hypothetical protein
MDNGGLTARVMIIAALALLPLTAGCDTFDFLGHSFGQAVRGGMPPSKGLEKARDPDFPDERRIGILTLVAYEGGRREPYTTLYMHMARDDNDYLVRATAVRALNRSRWKPAEGVFVSALDDPSDLVRLEGCKALVHLPDERAVPGLLKLISGAEPNKDVRIAAADALRHYRSIEVARTLVAQLNDRDFGIAWQAHSSLCALTGRDMRYSEGAWLNYLTGRDRPLG